MSKLALLTAGLLIIPAPVAAQITVDDAPIKVALAKPNLKSDLDRIECRAEDTTGSRLQRNRVCLTKQQWWSYEQEAKQRVQQWQIVAYANNH